MWTCFCFVFVLLRVFVNLWEWFTCVLQWCFTGTGAIVLPQCQIPWKIRVKSTNDKTQPNVNYTYIFRMYFTVVYCKFTVILGFTLQSLQESKVDVWYDKIVVLFSCVLYMLMIIAHRLNFDIWCIVFGFSVKWAVLIVIFFVYVAIWGIVSRVCVFKNTYELLNLRAHKFQHLV